MGRAGSILDPTRTQLVDVGWRVEEPKTDRQNQSVELILGEGERRLVRWSSESKKSHRNLQKMSLESTFYCRNLHFITGICIFFFGIYIFFCKKLLYYGRIWLNPTRFGLFL